MYKLEGLDYYLIPTAEVPVTNMYRGDIIDGSKLPMSSVLIPPASVARRAAPAVTPAV